VTELTSERRHPTGHVSMVGAWLGGMGTNVVCKPLSKTSLPSCCSAKQVCPVAAHHSAKQVCPNAAQLNKSASHHAAKQVCPIAAQLNKSASYHAAKQVCIVAELASVS